MRDYLGRHAWVNQFPQNPTQVVWRRFQRMPWGELPDTMKIAETKFEKMSNAGLKTHYSDIWRD
jgi:hypothetical protein